MKISFDLDDTLLFNDEGPIDTKFSPLIRGSIHEYLRLGVDQVFNSLRGKGHSIGIYTNSYRGKTELENWFSTNGLPVDFVINQQLHDVRIDKEKIRAGWPDKCPHLFDIDLHIDDLAEIKDSLKSHCKVILIQPDNHQWSSTLISEIEKINPSLH